MKILVADDEAVSLRLLESHVERLGFDVVRARGGEEAWERYLADEQIAVAILDWMMPDLDGVELCRRMRGSETGKGNGRPLHILLCTARDATEDVVEALEAGANDYLTKPVRAAELRARLRVGVRTVELEAALQRRIAELRDALDHVRQLQEVLPICMHCKSIRTGPDAWSKIETYLSDHADVKFSHGLCDTCLETMYPDVSAAEG